VKYGFDQPLTAFMVPLDSVWDLLHQAPGKGYWVSWHHYCIKPPNNPHLVWVSVVYN